MEKILLYQSPTPPLVLPQGVAMTVLRISELYMRNSVWWLRVAVPHSLREKAKRRTVRFAVGNELKTLTVDEYALLSRHSNSMTNVGNGPVVTFS